MNSRPHSQRNRIAPGKSASDRYLPLSDVFQSEIVVHGMAEFLLAAEIPLGCLNRCVAKEKLNLLTVKGQDERPLFGDAGSGGGLLLKSPRLG